MATSATMDERTARGRRRVRGRASVAAAVLSVVLGVLAGAFAATAPDDARTLLITGCVLGLAGALGCIGVVVANRALVSDPADPGPRVIAGTVLGGVLFVWLVAVVAVAFILQSLAWLVGGLGLVVLVLPAVVVAALTVRGPHPV
jgi:MFS family permease